MNGEMKLILDRIRDQDFSIDQATLTVYAEAFAAGLGAHGEAPMIRTTAQVLSRAVDAGLGHQDMAVVSTLDS